MRNQNAIISFTFDDFPRSALLNGGAILAENGAAGTYYASLGLMGQNAPTGEIFQTADIPHLLQSGHELGCHTFDHCHAYNTPARDFEKSVVRNGQALRALAAPVQFQTLSYPISCPRPDTKRRCARYFAACRSGGQTDNSGRLDLNNMQAYFLEQSRGNSDGIKAAIDACCRRGGWLIFATHDVCRQPTRFGCEPGFFAEIVRYSVNSGAEILPVSAGLAAIGATPAALAPPSP
jgi:hypothetical protein